MDQPQPTPPQIQVRAADADIKGVYSNVMQVGSTREEFVFDFFNMVGGSGALVSRVVVSPAHAKRILEALKEGIAKHEREYGAITAGPGPSGELGFKT
ncbi:MAG: DUF3467 domain-containing protein [Candidatus Liptonbacteria bacterium]|nr:DUF3467 domain-containing protein [Candidatus Liptonbacteria bacterium]